MAGTQVRVVADNDDVFDVMELDYSDDMMIVGDEQHLTISNNRGRYTGKLALGSSVSLYMSHPEVDGGAPTLRHFGRIVRREAESSPSSGNIIKLTTADLGWHLAKCCAPLWFNLLQGTDRDLLDPARSRPGRSGKRSYFIDPSFGIKGYRGSNKVNRRLKQTLANERARDKDENKIFSVQVEPGDVILDKQLEYTKRHNLLINVSADGFVQAWNPDYERKASYKIFRRGGESNIISGKSIEDATTAYTEVECVGEQFGWNENESGPNAGKKRGKFTSAMAAEGQKSPLPFVHRHTFADPDMYEKKYAQRHAEWAYKRGQFDSFSLEYVVLDHHQNGLWWESDRMVSVDDEELGVVGNFYCQRVSSQVSPRSGNITTVLLRKPGLLTAFGGEYPGVPTADRRSTS